MIPFIHRLRAIKRTRYNSDINTLVERLGWWVGGSPTLITQLFQTFTYYCKCLPAIKRALNILSAIT